MSRYSLEIRPKKGKVLNFIIWDNDSGEKFEEQNLTMPRAEMILPEKMRWERKVKEINLQ